MPSLENDSPYKENLGESNSNENKYFNKNKVYRWISFAKQKCAFGFERLDNKEVPLMSSKVYGLSICFEKIQGWKVPKSLLNDLNSGLCEISLNLSLSLLHLKTFTFFGTTWIGTHPISLVENKVPEVIDIEYVDLVYLLSKLIDPSCIGVVEIIATRVEKNSKLTTAQYGCGWAMLSLFGQHPTQDISDGHDDVKTMSATFYKGSPRDIFEQSHSSATSINTLEEITGCTLQFKTFSHRKLIRMAHLLIENAIIGRYDVIPGLSKKKVTLPGDSRSKSLPCIGDLEVHEDKKSILIIPGDPVIASTFSTRLNDLSIHLSNRHSFEASMRSKVSNFFPIEDQGKVQILSRIVKIGCHNGHTVIAGQFQEYKLEEDDENHDILHVNSSILITGYVPHELMALVFVFEYLVGIPGKKDSLHNYRAIKTINDHNSDDFPTLPITAGYSVFLPSDGYEMTLKESTPYSDFDSKFDAELDMLHDDMIKIFSPNKIFKNESHFDQDVETFKVVFNIKVYDSNNDIIEDKTKVVDILDIKNIKEESPGKKLDLSEEKYEDLPYKSSEISLKSPRSDDGSLSDSIVKGDTFSSFLQLDRDYYKSKPFKDTISLSPRVDPPEFKTIKSSVLLDKSLGVNLSKSQEVAMKFIQDEKKSNKFIEKDFYHQSEFSQGSYRELTRGAKSKLSRHGFNSIQSESKNQDASSQYLNRHLESFHSNISTDLGIEYNDALLLNDISFQFAGLRYGSSSKLNDFELNFYRKPRAIYCSYQFYSCSSIKTEVMRVLPSESGEIGVLVREEAHARNETPLTLHHAIDCSNYSGAELHYFIEYLNTHSLYVDIWDADSLFHIGTCAIPLRRLLRQGQSTIKHAIECDIVDYNYNSYINGNYSSIKVISKGPVIGRIRGSINIIMSNTGMKGRHIIENVQHLLSPPSELNWRSFNENYVTKQDNSNSYRPKNIVRAKPLSESEPKLKTLVEQICNHTDSSTRSIIDIRGNDTHHTLTYDELVRLFKRFQGSIKFTIQYVGQLMKLLEVPSFESVHAKFLKYLINAKKKGINLNKEISNFSDSLGNLSSERLKESFHRILSYVGVAMKNHEINVLTSKYLLKTDHVNCNALLKSIIDEINRYEWSSVANRFKSTLHKATLSGLDVESFLVKFDSKNAFISIENFKKIFPMLHPFDKFSSSEELAITNYFSRRVNEDDNSSAKISLKLFFSFLGTSYDSFSKNQPTNIDPETFLKHFVEKARERGISLVSAFRHFDIDGSGSLSPNELELFFENLKLFDSSYDLKSHISQLMSHFDKLEDGTISIKTFLKGIGINDYVPDLIQNMTKIFAVAQEKGNLSLEEIFKEFKPDKNGLINAEALLSALNSFEIGVGLNIRDCSDLIKSFDQNGDGKVSTQEFCDFFKKRIYNLNLSKTKKKSDKLVERFINLLILSQDKGLTLEKIFQHFDKDHGGSLSNEELFSAIKSLPHFSNFDEKDVRILVEVIDKDGKNDISFEEFEEFVETNKSSLKNNYSGQSMKSDWLSKIKSLFKTSLSHGLTTEQLFSYLDSNKNGKITISEFENALKSLPHFKAIKHSDMIELVKFLDKNGKGVISISDFADLLLDKDQSKSFDNTDNNNTREIFIRHMRRISQLDGSVAGLLAFLDKDEDGLISKDALYRLLSRENIFDSIKRADIDKLIEPISLNENIDIALLLRLIEDPKFDPIIHSSKENNPDDLLVDLDEYDFSKNPEIRTTEKKLRAIGRILSNKGVNIENLFKQYDTRNSGMIRRSDFIDILSKSGFFILEKGKAFEEELKNSDDVSQLQKSQINKLKDIRSIKSDYPNHASKKSEEVKSSFEFQDHIESLSLVNWYRQGQKKMLLQRVLSHSLSISLDIYPRFGQTVFLEVPIRNPFNHEEFFRIEIDDPELKLLTNFDEWMYFRRHTKTYFPLGEDPVDPDIFDVDGNGIHFALLPYETFHLPFCFLSLIPFRDNSFDSNRHKSTRRQTDVRIISGSHGHVVSIFKINICPVSFTLDRSFTFYEVENTTITKKIKLMLNNIHINNTNNKFVHCIETDNENRLIFDYQAIQDSNSFAEINFKYRCPQYPQRGNFYVLIYDDPFHAIIDEIWHVNVQTQLKIDSQCSLGGQASLDLITRGDHFSRRVQAYADQQNIIQFVPNSPTQLVAGVYNRIVAKVSPKVTGFRRYKINLVDIDKNELLNSWVLNSNTTNPIACKEYNVTLSEEFTKKKITFKNPWDLNLNFNLKSSNEQIMKPRDRNIEIGPQGTVIIKLWFNKYSSACDDPVYLFLNDNFGQGEECFKFNLNI